METQEMTLDEFKLNGGKIPSPEAPYGYNNDGTPTKRRGRPPSGVAKTAKPVKAPGIKPPVKKTAQKDYRDSLGGLFQIGFMGLMAAGQYNKDFQLDAIALNSHSPKIIEALNDLAIDNPSFGAIFDKMEAIGPYGALIMAIMPLTIQIAVNHKAIPDSMAANIPMVTPRTTLLQHVNSMEKAAMEEQREWEKMVAEQQNETVKVD